ncbi:predicted protein [Histoplasma capsulatum G186AR]|uniref:Uncharacterized protein n=1 Tax=Ajellomyces capsulatus (strain G186AR / H82 / ATCC MYA-2454 / RMSCC 2432) TaxID=447093 RepID=C0NI96_AJECG|nr:uncharacterized protein HCBG_03068 [Histoplasma capsulatum G186AR]EEH09531.1 predicted protein [Histoplasma capsulatum G186AR]
MQGSRDVRRRSTWTKHHLILKIPAATNPSHHRRGIRCSSDIGIGIARRVQNPTHAAPPKEAPMRGAGNPDQSGVKMSSLDLAIGGTAEGGKGILKLVRRKGEKKKAVPQTKY